MSYKIQETYVNRTKGYQFGKSDIYEANADTVGELFHDLQKEFGRCDSKVYVDTKSGTKQVGWVFVSKQRYEDARPGMKEPEYLREVWVTVFEPSLEN